MVNEKELKIIEILKENMEESSFSDILKKSPFSREPTFRHLQKLHKQELIEKRKIANIYVYKLNFKENKLISLLSYLNYKKNESFQIDKDLKQTATLFALKSKNEVIVCIKGKGDDIGKNYKIIKFEDFIDRVLKDKSYRDKILNKYTPVFNVERFYEEIGSVLEW